MKTLKLTFIDRITKEGINTIEDLLSNKRLAKHLWIEFILNPVIVETCKLYAENQAVRNSLVDALSWYLAFRWILPENKALEGLQREKSITPYRIKNSIYRQKRREFLKGIIHAHLC
ncbi:MAG: hypothetical protein AABY42_00160 [Nitrospirota bacterium]